MAEKKLFNYEDSPWNFERVKDKPDRFVSIKASTIFKELQQCSLVELERCFLQVMNAEFDPDENVLFFFRTPNFLTVRCKYLKCPFQVWFYEKDSKLVEKNKSINFQHSIDSHNSPKDLKKSHDSRLQASDLAL